MFRIYDSGFVSRQIEWAPEQDITPFELAMMLPIFAIAPGDPEEAKIMIDNLPDQARRHWRNFS